MTKLIQFIARFIAVIIALSCWVVGVLPIWLFMLIREIAVSAVCSVAGAFGSPGRSNETERLDTVAQFWPAGFGRILGLMSKQTGNEPALNREGLQRLFGESLLAIFFYSAFFWFPEIFNASLRLFEKFVGQHGAKLSSHLEAFLPAWVAGVVPAALTLAVAVVLIRVACRVLGIGTDARREPEMHAQETWA